MQKKTSRWLILVLVGLAVLALVGFSFVPIFTGIMDNNRSQSTPSPTSSATTTTDSQTQQLQQQAKGYQLVLEREPENQTALKGLLEARLQLISQGSGKVEELLDPLQKLAKLNPAQAEYTVLLAQVQQQTGDREAAAQTYRNILALQPGNVDALQGFVTLLLQEERPAQAVDLLQNTLKTASQTNQSQPGSVDVPAVQLLLGQVYVSQQQFQEALSLYDELIKQDANDFRPVFAKAIVFQEQGKTQEAQTLFTSAEDLAPAKYKDQIKAKANSNQSTPDATPDEATTPAQTPSSSEN